MREAIGASVDVAEFVRSAYQAYGAAVSSGDAGRLAARSCEWTRARRLRRCVTRSAATPRPFAARFELPVRDGELYLSRTHPFVEGLASYVMDTALDPLGEGVARRCGVIRTARVQRADHAAPAAACATT